MKKPISSIAGFITSIFFFSATFISWALFPNPINPFANPFNPFYNWLSDLGNSSYNPNGAIVYNIGQILTGSAFFVFIFGLYQWYLDNKMDRVLLIIIQIIGGFAAFADIMIGIFSEDFPSEHGFWSTTFFITMVLVLSLGGLFVYRHPDLNKYIGLYGFVVAAFNLILVLSVNTFIIEWIAVFTMHPFLLMISINMYNKFQN